MRERDREAERERGGGRGRESASEGLIKRESRREEASIKQDAKRASRGQESGQGESMIG